jgi:FkbM family methyltransferase
MRHAEQSVLKRVLKAANIHPLMMRHPELIRVKRRGVSLSPYLVLRDSWLCHAEILTVLDIGANKGQFSSAAHQLFPEARIYAFEPLPSDYRLLVERFVEVPKFQAFNVALGEESGHLSFHQNESSPSSSALRITGLHNAKFPGTAVSKTIEVRMEPLDSFLPQLDLCERVLVKIDVQGFEDRVIRGGRRVIESADCVLVETMFASLYESQATFADVFALLSDSGFRFAGMLEQHVDRQTKEVLFGDAVFVAHHR